MTLRVVFAGTPEFALPCLEELLALHAAGKIALIGCYTQPDRPAGRGQKDLASPIKQQALAAGIAVFTPETLKDADVQAQLRALAPDLMMVVAYGQILPKRVLAIPQHGCWNVHASLLPRWRGAAPIQRAIEAGDAQTGVCLMQMQAGLDTGPVMLRAALEIAADDTAQSLHDRLSTLGATLLQQGITRLIDGSLPAAQPQPETGVCYAHKLDKAEAALDFQQSAALLARRVRAFIPFPLAETLIAGERVQILKAHALADQNIQADIKPELGSLLGADKHGLRIACAEGVLCLTQLKTSQGKLLSAAEFLNGRAKLQAQLAAARAH
jgi:methionyl-tRNA formyltransferase